MGRDSGHGPDLTKARLSRQLRPAAAQLGRTGTVKALARAKLVRGMANRANFNPAACNRMELCAYLKGVDEELTPKELKKLLYKPAKDKTSRQSIHRYLRDNVQLTDSLIEVADSYVGFALGESFPVSGGGSNGNGAKAERLNEPTLVKSLAVSEGGGEAAPREEGEIYEGDPLEGYLKLAQGHYPAQLLDDLALTVDAYGGHQSFFEIVADKNLGAQLVDCATRRLQDKYAKVGRSEAAVARDEVKKADRETPKAVPARLGLAIGLGVAACATVGASLIYLSFPTLAFGLVAAALLFAAGPMRSYLAYSRIYDAHRERAFTRLQSELEAKLAEPIAQWVHRSDLAQEDISRARLVERTLLSAGRDPYYVTRAKLTALLRGRAVFSSLSLDGLPTEARRHFLATEYRAKIGAIGKYPASRVTLWTKFGWLVEVAGKYVRDLRATPIEARLVGPDHPFHPQQLLDHDSVRRFGHYPEPELAAMSGYYRGDGLAVAADIEFAVRNDPEYVFPEEAVTRDEVAGELTEGVAALEAARGVQVPRQAVYDEWLGRDRGKAKRRVRQGRPGLALGLGVAACAALVPAFVFLAPASHWQPALVLAVLGAITIVGYLLSSMQTSKAHALNPSVAPLVALVLLGPLPAAIMWIAQEVAALAIERYRGDAFVANVASYGWASLVGGLLFASLVSGPQPDTFVVAWYGSMAAVGLVMFALNYLIIGLLLTVVRDGEPSKPAIKRDYLMTLPADVVMTGLAVLATFAYAQVGIVALGFFAAIILVPQMLVPRLVPAAERVASSSRTGALALRVAGAAGLFPRVTNAPALRPKRAALNS